MPNRTRTRKREISATQLDALEMMIAHDADLVRVRGGFWTVRPFANERSPSWWIYTNTVYAMTRAGLVDVADDNTPAWCVDRVITDAGRAAVTVNR